MSYFPQQSNRLEPAETFLDPFPLPLADAVTGVTRRPRVEGTAAAPTLILRHVRRNLHVAALGDEVGRINLTMPARHPRRDYSPGIRLLFAEQGPEGTLI